MWLSEHHFIDDGYLQSILLMAAAIAARTKRIRISSGVLLMPFHNPVRLAEDIAVVDVLSGGRFELGVGVGFKHEKFEGFRVPFKERGGRTNESLEIVRRLLSGENVTFNLFQIKRHCYARHERINPTRIVPKGPVIDFTIPHDRGRRFG